MIGLQMLAVVLIATVAVLPGLGLTLGFMWWAVGRDWHIVPGLAGALLIALSYCVAASLVLAMLGHAVPLET